MGCRLLVSLFLMIGFSGVLTASPLGDFDNDGKVDFQDFVLFVRKYDTRLGDPIYEARFDLNTDGKIDSDDFSSFAEIFGDATVAAKPATEKPKESDIETRAKAAQVGGDYAEAAKQYQTFLATATIPRDKARGLVELGITYVGMDSLGLASEQLNKVFKEYGETNDPKIKLQLANCAAVLGQIGYLQGEMTLAYWHWSQISAYLPPLPSVK